jgi:uncharacterized protein
MSIHFVEKPVILSLKIHLKSGQEEFFADWQAKLNAAIVAFPGFVSLEFVNSTPAHQEWTIVERFKTIAQATAWKASSPCRQILNELRSIVIEQNVEETLIDQSPLIGGVTEVIVVEVLPEKETVFREWIAKIHALEAKFEGFRGVYVQSPIENHGKFWITLLQFDTIEHLDQWITSSTRQDILSESKGLIAYMEHHRVISPYAGWFASIARIGQLPALWKQTMVILLVLFPIVMLEFKYLNPHLDGLNLSLSTFIGNALSVSLISFPAMPFAIYCLKWWLLPNPAPSRWINLAGAALVFVLYLLEIWFFWNFV